MPSAPKSGPLTREEILRILISATDPSYHEPFLLAGEGGGLEALTQACEQFARVSLAIDRTTQAMYLRAWSGQSDEPARGGRRSVVVLRISRASLFELPVVLDAGTIVEEVATDFSPEGAIDVFTGRRYVLRSISALMPGETEILVVADAEREGYGYDAARPGTIRAISSPGAGLSNDRASVVPGVGGHRLVVAPEPDVAIPEHVGGYVLLEAGANAGRLCRVVAYAPPEPTATPPNGGSLTLAAEGLYTVSLKIGDFIPGESVEQPVTGATGVAVRVSDARAILVGTSGVFATGSPVFGQESGSQFTPAAIEISPALIAESGTCAWRALSFADDLALESENELSPVGGRSAMLDERGRERKISRASGESDDDYAARLARPADTISPNAIRRTINRVLAPYGASGCLREVGQRAFPGLFFDGDPGSTDPAIAFAFDLDFDTRPDDRFKVLLDYLEFRAFMLIGVPPLDFGEFGAAFDSGANNAFDAAPYPAFFDGYAVTAAAIYRTVWQAVDRARAAGVGFDLYLETGTCPLP